MSDGRVSQFAVVILTAAWLVVGVTVRADQGSPAPKTTAQAIEGGLTCQCGCQQTVSGCNHEGCGDKAEMQAMAEKEVASGKDNPAILQDFVLKYGTKVLATPPPTGFNLMVWILPILGGMIGLTLVVTLVRRWRHAPAMAPTEATPPIDPEMRAEVEEEMKRITSER
ncbi:MAG TPA: cytochrome c-type biogenesis protein CcmH [Terriglobia bacterium]